MIVPFISFSGRSCFAEEERSSPSPSGRKLKSPPIRVVFQLPRLAFSSPSPKHEKPLQRNDRPEGLRIDKLKKQAFHFLECLFLFMRRATSLPRLRNLHINRYCLLEWQFRRTIILIQDLFQFVFRIKDLAADRGIADYSVITQVL